MSNRDIIFVSHANPQDNLFTMWLCTQLANAGYKIWSDLTHLIGGENTWDNIEPIIRDHTAKFLFIITDTSQKKDGVKDELNLAVTIERTQKLADFVIPLRLEAIPFANLQININRKNAIDFSKSWPDGLQKIIQKLEKDSVSKKQDGYALDVAKWYEKSLNTTAIPAYQKEPLVSNWLPVKSLPDNIYFCNLDTVNTKINEVAASAGIPFFRHHRMIGSFAHPLDWEAEIAPLSATKEYEINTQSAIENGHKDRLGLERKRSKKPYCEHDTPSMG